MVYGGEHVQMFPVGYLPIVSAYEAKMGLVEEIDRLVDPQMGVSPGQVVLALLIWRLMERTMRLNLRTTQSTITGWEKRQTSRPTSLMLTTKFVGIFVLASSLQRRLARPLNPLQLRYLELLDLTQTPFSTHLALSQTQDNGSEKSPKLFAGGAEC